MRLETYYKVTYLDNEEDYFTNSTWEEKVLYFRVDKRTSNIDNCLLKVFGEHTPILSVDCIEGYFLNQQRKSR